MRKKLGQREGFKISSYKTRITMLSLTQKHNNNIYSQRPSKTAKCQKVHSSRTKCFLSLVFNMFKVNKCYNSGEGCTLFATPKIPDTEVRGTKQFIVITRKFNCGSLRRYVTPMASSYGFGDLQ